MSLFFDCRHRHSAEFELNAQFQTTHNVAAIFGPSGSGKSTVLSIIAGIYHPQQGELTIDSCTLFSTRRGVRIPAERRQVGMVFQDHLLFPHLTVRHNLQFGARRRPAREFALDRVVEILELGDLLDRYPDTLSGGERQRTALGRAILRGPRLLLMDEPLAALDAGLKQRILVYLRHVIDEYRIPTILVSHDQTDVRRLAEQVIVLHHGKVIDSGPVHPTLDKVLTQQMISDAGPMNLLHVSQVHEVNGQWEGMINGQPFRLPSELIGARRGDAEQGHYVRFSARDVILSRTPIEGVSARHQLRGQVCEVVAQPDRLYVAIDVGQFCWAELTPEAGRDLEIRPGLEVTCVIKARAVHSVE